jgi:hypothetical protein
MQPPSRAAAGDADRSLKPLHAVMWQLSPGCLKNAHVQAAASVCGCGGRAHVQAL